MRGPGSRLQAPSLSNTFSNYRIVLLSNDTKIIDDFNQHLNKRKFYSSQFKCWYFLYPTSCPYKKPNIPANKGI